MLVRVYDMLTGKYSKEEIDYQTAINAYEAFIAEVHAGVSETKYDAIIKELLSENIHVVGESADDAYWFRARKHSNFHEQPYTYEDIGINRRNPMTGRWNEYGEGLLYLSKTRDNALEEIQAETTNIVSVGRFFIGSGIRVADFSNAALADTYGYYGGLNSFHARYFLVLLIANYFKAQSSPNIYRVTNFVSKLIQSLGLDGILYESVKNEAVDCLALTSMNQVYWKNTRQWRIDTFIENKHKFDCSLLKTLRP